MENITTLNWLVLFIGALAATLGGFVLARNLPRIAPLGLLGEVLGSLAAVYLFTQNVPVLFAIAPLLIGSAGTLAGVLMNRNVQQQRR